MSSTTLHPLLFQAANWTQTFASPNSSMRVASYGYTAGPDDTNGFPVGVMGVTDQGFGEDVRGVGLYGVVNDPNATLPEPSVPTGVYGYAKSGTGATAVGVTGHAVGSGGNRGATGVSGRAEGRGFGVRGETDDGVGVYGVAKAAQGIGVLGDTTGNGAIGVSGLASGADSTGVWAYCSNGGVGVYAGATASSTALWVDGRLRQTPSAAAGPPPGAASAGEQWRDSAGAMFLCTSSGSPGTWRKVVAQHPDYATAGGSINLLARPIRVVDTRPTSTAPLRACSESLTCS